MENELYNPDSVNRQEEFRTPILLLIFSRPDTTQAVFNAIREIKPPRLYVGADGPRNNKPGEAEKCEATRSIIDQVDWDCEVKTLFRDENLGCGIAPHQAMNWFFEQEEMGIILEDDILPSQSFFWYCQELLEKYKDDERVMEIAAMNYLGEWKPEEPESYYFSWMGTTWGWASWSRAWKHYNYNIPDFQIMREQGKVNHYFFTRPDTDYVMDKLEQAYQRDPNITWWDYQWMYTRITRGGVSIIPKKNLAVNIGFGDGSTHTTEGDNQFEHMELEEMDLPLVHPTEMVVDEAADLTVYEKYHGLTSWEKIKMVIRRFLPQSILNQP